MEDFYWVYTWQNPETGVWFAGNEREQGLPHMGATEEEAIEAMRAVLGPFELDESSLELLSGGMRVRDVVREEADQFMWYTPFSDF